MAAWSRAPPPGTPACGRSRAPRRCRCRERRAGRASPRTARRAAPRSSARCWDSRFLTLLGVERDVHPLDVERHAAGRKVPAEAPEQVVVAAAAADREAHGGVVHLEHGARVVTEL